MFSHVHMKLYHTNLIFFFTSCVLIDDKMTSCPNLCGIQTDPFHSVSQLSKEEKETARNQTIPSLLQLLNLAKQHNISVIFDLRCSNPENDTMDTVNTILESGIDPSLVSLLLIPPVEFDIFHTFDIFQTYFMILHGFSF